ncbi:MAG TPA: ROK family protein, partial [Pseudothermotoga sp.]|nr:ROK family protein [Pseudothermotoga sp.]
MSPLLLGIDIGGTAIKGGIVEKSTIVWKTVELIEMKNPFETLVYVIGKLVEHADTRPEAIGIASAGRIDSEKGIVVYATSNLKN